MIPSSIEENFILPFHKLLSLQPAKAFYPNVGKLLGDAKHNKIIT